MSDLPREAETFLRGLERSLSALPAEERREVVKELRSHLEDRAAQGAADLLAPFGRPEAYAAAFLEERALCGALATGSSFALGRALLSGARRLGWWYAVAALGLVEVVGGGLVALAALKLFWPGKVGLFFGPGVFFLGMRDGETGPAVELLGYWAVPFFLFLGVAALFSANWSLRTLAAWRLARARTRGG
jgi:hypothetical protein